MPLRAFVSSTGESWQVWNVIPGNRGSEERRAGYERRSPDPVLLYRGLERRVHPDRRRNVDLPPELRTGWLVFESPSERRRLAPIPPGWDRLPDTALERLCDEARRASTPAPGTPAGEGASGGASATAPP